MSRKREDNTEDNNIFFVVFLLLVTTTIVAMFVIYSVYLFKRKLQNVYQQQMCSSNSSHPAMSNFDLNRLRKLRLTLITRYLYKCTNTILCSVHRHRRLLCTYIRLSYFNVQNKYSTIQKGDMKTEKLFLKVFFFFFFFFCVFLFLFWCAVQNALYIPTCCIIPTYAEKKTNTYKLFICTFYNGIIIKLIKMHYRT